MFNKAIDKVTDLGVGCWGGVGGFFCLFSRNSNSPWHLLMASVAHKQHRESLVSMIYFLRKT